MMSIAAIIFDFNGVLVDDEAIHFALFQEILAQEGVVITERDYHERYLGYDDRGCFLAAMTDGGLVADYHRIDQMIAQKAQRYFEVAEHSLRFFPGAAEILQSVAARWPVAICSGALRPEIEYALQRLGRLDQIAVIISAEDTKKGKPDPEGYLLALAALREHLSNNSDNGLITRDQQTPPKLRAADCLVLEDSLAGIASAKEAGMYAVGIPNTYRVDQLRNAGADQVVDGLSSLTPDWIEQRLTC
jgi:beta-phosphoglucomutase-like phosphatase (HAD superfamily)